MSQNPCKWQQNDDKKSRQRTDGTIRSMLQVVNLHLKSIYNLKLIGSTTLTGTA